MISDIPKIKVSGITYPIYAADFSWGGADNPSSMTIDYVNKNGIYKTPKLNTSQAVTIEFGSFFKFTGYPVSWTKSNKGEKLLSVKYVDTSIILDKVFVGLKGVHGAPPQNLNGVDLDGTTVEGFFGTDIVLLGRYVDPCEGVTDSTVDPCNPCLTRTEFITVEEDNTSKYIKCDEERFTSLLDVNYTFNDLISGLRLKGIQFYDIPTVNTNYYGRYSGPARDVLRSWCSDLGITFFWDKNGIRFVDLKKGITINDSSFYTACQLLSTQESESIENSKSVGNIYYFGAEGEVKKYDCGGAAGGQFYKLSLIPITLKDIFALENGNMHPHIRKYYNRNNGNSVTGLQSAVVLSYYSRMLRDMTLLYNFYEVTDASSIAPGTKFPLLGMTVKQVWDVDDAATAVDSRVLFWNAIPESIRKKATAYGAAVAVVEINDKWHERFFEFENSLAERFFGRYWISFFSKGDKYDYSGPDGTPEYFDAGTPLTLPFSELIPDSIKTTSPFLARIVNQSAQRNKSGDHVGDVVTDNPNTFASSFLLMDRNPAWEPLENNDAIKLAEESLREMYFYNVEPFKEQGMEDQLGPNEYFMLIFDKPNKFDLTYYDETPHPIEKENVNRRTTLEGFTTTYGLRSDNCKPYRLQIKVTGDKNNPSINHQIDFAPPVQAYDDYGVNFPGYSIIASKNDGVNSDSMVSLERKEYIYGDVSTASDETTGIIINFKDVTSMLQSLLIESGTSCGYDISAVRTLVSNLKIASPRPKAIKQIEKSYTLAGFPTRVVQLSDGLSSLSVRYNSSNGISTEVGFSNTPPITKSENIIDQEVERNLLKRLLGRRFRSSRNKINL